MKRCSNQQCLEINPQPFSAFYKNTSKKDGYESACKTCTKKDVKRYQDTNKEAILKKQRRRREQVKADQPLYEERRAYQKKYRKENKEYINKKGREYHHANKPKIKIKSKEYRERNKEALKAKKQEYYRNNKKKLGEYRKNYWKIRRKNEPVVKLRYTIRRRILLFLKSRGLRKNRRTAEIIGCTFQELKQHIESQFKPGMSWDNHGPKTWHIDHKIPLASAVTEKEIYDLCHYTNLQPLWANDNLTKSDKLPILDSSIPFLSIK